MSGFIQRNASSAFFAIIIAAVPVWWINDREPPYTRENGRIVAAAPEMCGLKSDYKQSAGLVAGACASVEWKITPKRNCKPHGRFNVTRAIVDQQGRHPLPPIDSVYSRDGSVTGITRYFALPQNSPVGPAKYVSEALFDCNFGQRILPFVFWPICVGCNGIGGRSGSDFVDFMVGEPPVTRGPR